MKKLFIVVLLACDIMPTYAGWHVDYGVRKVQGFFRITAGINVPIPSLIFTHRKYINKIEGCMSECLTPRERENAFIFSNIPNYNSQVFLGDKVNDCIKFGNINNLMGTYKDAYNNDVTFLPFFIINAINALKLSYKMNTYLRRNIEAKYGLLWQDAFYDYILGFHSLELSRNGDNINGNKDFEIKMLKALKHNRKIQKILDECMYKRFKVVPLNVSLGYTHWFNNMFGLDVDISCSYLYISYGQNLCLPELSLDVVKEGVVQGLNNGHIVNIARLKSRWEKPEIVTDEILRRGGGQGRLGGAQGRLGGWQGVFAGLQDWFVGVQGFMGAWTVSSYYKTLEGSDDVATRVFAQNFFDDSVIPPLDEAFFRLQFTFQQISPTFKVGFVFNLKQGDNFIKYNNELLAGLHQLVISPGIRINITSCKINLDIDENCKALDNIKGKETAEKKKKRYSDIKKNYDDLMNGSGVFPQPIKDTVKYFRNDFLPKIKTLPLIEIKYRYNAVCGFTFEIGTIFYFRSFFNIIFDKQPIYRYYASYKTTVPKYENNTTNEDLLKRQDEIKKNILSFESFPEIDLGFFVSIGWSWEKFKR
ncbi:MAG: hypothetical protein II393_01255 [Cytophagales bacterium]|nr:hypothetical protein [Cytophagales bacterium]